MTRAWEKLFLYGSLLVGQHSELRQLVEESSVSLGPARLRALLYSAGEYPAAVATRDGEDWVLGELRAIDPACRQTLLSKLDQYEGVRSYHGDKAYFRRSRVRVIEDGGDETHEAWAYLYAKSTADLVRIPDGDWLGWVANPRVRL